MAYDSKTLDAVADAFMRQHENDERRGNVSAFMEMETGWEGEDEDRHMVPVVRQPDCEIGIPETRSIVPYDLNPAPKPLKFVAPTPEVRFVFPQQLRVEAAYQRDLSPGSVALIRKIVNGWDWTKFKPPVVADTQSGLYVIDGQHTAIAAATRGIRKIPVLVVTAPKIEARAQAFVAHNRDRLNMSPLQVFHAEVTGGEALSVTLMKLCRETGAIIPRSMPGKNAKPGHVLPVRELKRAISAHGERLVARILTIAVGAELAPLNQTTAAGLITVMTAGVYADVARQKDSALSNAVRALGDIDVRSRTLAAEMGVSHWRAAAKLIADEARRRAAL